LSDANDLRRQQKRDQKSKRQETEGEGHRLPPFTLRPKAVMFCGAEIWTFVPRLAWQCVGNKAPACVTHPQRATTRRPGSASVERGHRAPRTRES
jgi:hypothetical protein